MQPSPSLGTENQSPFQVDSRREIISLLRGLKDNNQLISMLINSGSEVYLTSILEIDDTNNSVIVDSAPSQLANQRIVEAPRVSFEGLLDKIGIQFSTTGAVRTDFENRPALQFSIPASIIRLQRRENYRINTPLSTPLKASFHLDTEGQSEVLKLSLVDISCGGIAVLDEKRQLDCSVGQTYEHCKVELPGIGLVDVSLQIRNSQDLILLNGKTNRRVGCQFINLSNSVLSSIQRYIMKLERERNSKLTGIR
ncbi:MULTISPECIES: flagellar brake protein [unclassified Undibacterium]|uniref:flagellar brake protein n=2 Tax=Undibacterium TaxID=401469 RepID=UPI002AC97CA2|nr:MULTISPECIES: flagellar brake protein [unclassified Undibacterium]MEB0139853.1 flagellar brake protein [Undibacterium sp. CCC2.1]MEB0172783.1 flagellar brake protein [Undibacterium sp. CCC1.1]MEB0176575.1 flagellar brake protein [Undibacterium sp. CCC3.4]MEB0215835.1 flagellar brake protein [Undibacterium sp. 5I2]WPX42686.1 flagellar brake protein [Undibacterium sp. CCC3.4]